MRSENEMLDIILTTARNDERIRAAILNGSRVNPDAPKDFFQDYDVIYVVTETAPFVRNLKWIQRFGDLMILQLPDDMGGEPKNPRGSYCYLMQFMDGNRIDLTVYPLNRIKELEGDSLSLALLDKDGILPAFPAPSNRSNLPKPPTAKQFFDCCNEFWWVSPYVAKGLWRDELPYAKNMMELVREQLLKMLDWYVGVGTGFKKSMGKEGKYLKKFLEPKFWQMLERTYAGAHLEDNWQALLVMGSLFRRLARTVGEHFGYDYLEGEDERVTAHLKHVRELPKDAPQMY